MFFSASSNNTPFTLLLREAYYNHDVADQKKLVSALLKEMDASRTPSVVLNKYMSVHGISKVIRKLFTDFVNQVKSTVADSAKLTVHHILPVLNHYGVNADLKLARALLNSSIFKSVNM